ESGVVAYSRLVVEANENSEVTIVERFVSCKDAKSLIVPVVDVRAAQSARVTYVAINELGGQLGKSDTNKRLVSATQRCKCSQLHWVAIMHVCAPRFASKARVPALSKLHFILPTKIKCTTFVRFKIMRHRARTAICCSRVPSKTRQKVFTRV
ncbi:MAG: hypothetical protein EBQ54_02450, partial [Actinobacteria bacterium]|nr:hypothetical protein [Actinomycetota bacterium]